MANWLSLKEAQVPLLAPDITNCEGGRATAPDELND